jgi:outer membrane protein OmpA-like peptidoglycan-associated protein
MRMKKLGVQRKWSCFVFILILATGMLGGCAHQSVNTNQYRVLLLQHRLAEKLKKEGIQVIVVGDEVTLILPVSKFFYENSNHMRQAAESLLNHLIAYINIYPGIEDIQVKGYTSNRGDYQRNLALSRAQAQAVAHYLWNHGLNSRLISAQGYGCHHPYGRDLIEIFFRLPPPDNVFH